jgi:hypothetical protein
MAPAIVRIAARLRAAITGSADSTATLYAAWCRGELESGSPAALAARIASAANALAKLAATRPHSA